MQVIKGNVNNRRSPQYIVQSRENDALTQTRMNEIINITDRELKKQNALLQRLEDNDNKKMNDLNANERRLSLAVPCPPTPQPRAPSNAPSYASSQSRGRRSSNANH